VQDQIHRLLKDVVDEFNMSLIMITHSLGVIREQVDRVYVMYAGRVVEEAATSTLFNNPSHPYTKGLFDSVPKIRGGGLSEGIYGYVPDYVTIEDRCRFFDRCSLRQPICEQLGHPELVEIDNSHFVSCYVVSGTHADERKVVNG
jgi:peptide/nickel transport system ATP-binding protein